MEHYLIDTNIVSDYFSCSLPFKGMQLLDKIIDATPNLSIITQIELLCWNMDAPIEQYVKNFIADSLILNINPTIITHCVTLRKTKKIKTPDAIIAATALAYKFILVTNNEKDFTNIDDLQLMNPHKL